MQRGCMQRNSRKEGPVVWQFRWSETRLDGTRLYHKKIIGTVEQYPDEDAARRSVMALVSELNTDGRPTNCSTMTVAQLCDHFEQRELAKENSWRSHATKKIYKAYLARWIRPHWKKYQLAEVRTIQVESWLRGLPLAKSSCAKIRNVMSVLFNHACRYELSDRNPIYLARQSAKRRTPPATLVPAEIKALIDGLALRERTLVLLAALALNQREPERQFLQQRIRQLKEIVSTTCRIPVRPFDYMVKAGQPIRHKLLSGDTLREKSVNRVSIPGRPVRRVSGAPCSAIRNFPSAAQSKILYKGAALIRCRLTLKEKKCVSHFSAI